MKPRLLFMISLALNVVLVVFLGRTPKAGSRAAEAPAAAEGVPSPQPAQESFAPVSMPAPVLPIPSPTRASEPFHWNSLESTNYSVYIHNLRAIGCPEQTIRDIVAADLHSLYKGRFAGVAEEYQVLNSLFSSPSASGPTVVPAPASEVDAGSAGVQTPDRSPHSRLPLAFAPVDPAILGLGPQQQAALESLKSRFIEEVGGAGADSKDPQYHEKWKDAQPRADQRMKAMLGVQAFLRYDLESRRPVGSSLQPR